MGNLERPSRKIEQLQQESPSVAIYNFLQQFAAPIGGERCQDHPPVVLPPELTSKAATVLQNITDYQRATSVTQYRHFKGPNSHDLLISSQKFDNAPEESRVDQEVQNVQELSLLTLTHLNSHLADQEILYRLFSQGGRLIGEASYHAVDPRSSKRQLLGGRRIVAPREAYALHNLVQKVWTY